MPVKLKYKALFRHAASALAIGAMALTAQSRAQTSPNKLTDIPAKPFDYAGFIEDKPMRVATLLRPASGAAIIVSRPHIFINYAILQQNKAELDQAMQKCEPHSADLKSAAECDPAVAGFNNMLAVARGLPNPLMKLALVSGWVNTAIQYDHKAVQSGYRRSLVQSLREAQAVCDEMAQLKFRAVQLLGFTDSRYIAAATMTQGKPSRPHAFVFVRVADKMIVLDNWQDTIPKRGPLSRARIWQAFNINGALATDFDHANNAATGKAALRRKDLQIFPLQALTYNDVAYFRDVGLAQDNQTPVYQGKPIKPAARPGLASFTSGFNALSPSDRTSVETIMMVALLAYDPRYPSPTAQRFAPTGHPVAPR